MYCSIAIFETMPFPLIRHCLICEEVRPEVKGKLSILGFYGVTPDVSIRIQDLAKPIERLCFLLVSGPGDGDHKVSIRIEGPAGELVFTGPESDFSFPSSPQPLNLVITVALIPFAVFGRHRFVFVVQGSEMFQTSFEIQKEIPAGNSR